MKNPDIDKAPVELMIKGLRNLKKLGVNFLPSYGASPLYDFDGLPEYIKAATDLGIYSTVIVDGVGGDKDKEKIKTLYVNGLRSLTVSYDFHPYDISSSAKSAMALPLVKWFSKLSDIRDVEIVSTVTKDSYTSIMYFIKSMLENHPKLWFSFDFLHTDRGNPGTKCRGKESELLLSADEVKEFSTHLLTLKQNGYRIHQSVKFLEKCIKNPEIATLFNWKCAPDKVFPSWLTIDADGSVLPCDDFYTDRSWKIWDFDITDFQDFTEFYSKEVKNKCKGCGPWSTHYDAHGIKRGDGLKFNNYIHKGREINNNV